MLPQLSLLRERMVKMPSKRECLDPSLLTLQVQLDVSTRIKISTTP